MAKSTQEKKVSVREFAARIGVSEGAVRKAIKKWSFTIGVQEDGKIDTEAAAKDPWVQKQLVVRPKAGVSREKAAEKIEAREKPPPAPVKNEDQEHIEDDGDWDIDEDIADKIKVHKGLKTAEAMRRREIVALAMDKKKLQELERVLVRRDAVEKAFFLLGSELKKSLLDIPNRCVADIMAAKTEVEAIKILTEELIHVLDTYGNLKSNTL